ncbi:MAG TPA: fused MFS/spermidine synthase [Thermoanaerobaculaceae bacterium]|nr:fused MFS/spermidine synthase [Thermoanaerobaculaceae bacterium]
MAALVTVLFVVSGMVALAYEVVWVRALGLVVGNSLWAAVSVVAAYMAGMALGGVLVARLARRVRSHLRWYGAAEAVAAGVALATPFAIPVLEKVAAGFGPAPLAGWGVPLIARFGIAWTFLALPTVAMGATLPLLVARIGAGDPTAWRVGRLYSANTLGAVAGVVLAGFVALPALGERGTLSAFAIAGLLVAGVAWVAEPHLPRGTAQADQSAAPARRMWLAVPAWFGFVALASELVWTRVLLLNLGSRVYAFAIILAVYLAGVAGGASLARFVRSDARRALAACQVLLAVSMAVQVPVLGHLGDVLAWLAARGRFSSFAALQCVLAAAVAAAIVLPTLAFGASFPLSVAAYPSDAAAEARTGEVAAANTAGAILGSIAGPLLLVPAFGSQNLILGLGAAAALVGGALARTRPGRVAACGVAALVVAEGFATPPGTVLRGAAAVTEGVVETLRESASATVVVRRITDQRGTWRSLELNGVNVAGTSPELRAIQRLQGHLPLLLCPRPEKVLHIGFGSGGTALAVTRHPVRAIVVAEISPEVLEVSDKVFGDVNRGALHDPRVRVVLNDGRNVLLATRETFDVILSDSIHPVYAGNSTLYTREYFELCRSRLRPGGVVSMWLPMYSLTSESYLAIVRAFWEVFPGTCIWYDPVVLNEFTVVTGVAAPGPVRVRWDALDDPALRETLAEAGVRGPASLAAMLLLGPREVAALVADVPAHVDDFPEVEYRSGRLLDRDGSWLENMRVLWAARTTASPFAALPGGFDGPRDARDLAVRRQLRELSARIAHR